MCVSEVVEPEKGGRERRSVVVQEKEVEVLEESGKGRKGEVRGDGGGFR